MQRKILDLPRKCLTDIQQSKWEKIIKNQKETAPIRLIHLVKTLSLLKNTALSISDLNLIDNLNQEPSKINELAPEKFFSDRESQFIEFKSIYIPNNNLSILILNARSKLPNFNTSLEIERNLNDTPEMKIEYFPLLFSLHFQNTKNEELTAADYSEINKFLNQHSPFKEHRELVKLKIST